MLEVMRIEDVAKDSVLTNEEGFALTQHYVHYYWVTNKFYSLKNQYEEDDVVMEIYIKFLSKHFFEKYKASITSKKYHVMNGVRTSMIDMLRKYRDLVSLEKEIADDNLSLIDTLADDADLESDVIDRLDSEDPIHVARRNQILEELPDKTSSKITGYSELLGREVNISYRMLALHLEAGYTVSRLAEMYKNPKSGKKITQGNVAKHIANMREFILNNIVVGF